MVCAFRAVADVILAMTGPRTTLSRMLPPPGVPRAIAFQSAMLAVGSGTLNQAASPPEIADGSRV